MSRRKPGYRISDAVWRLGFPAFEARYRHTYSGAEGVAIQLLGRGWTTRVAIESRHVGKSETGPWGDRREFELAEDDYVLVHVIGEGGGDA